MLPYIISLWLQFSFFGYVTSLSLSHTNPSSGCSCHCHKSLVHPFNSIYSNPTFITHINTCPPHPQNGVHPRLLNNVTTTPPILLLFFASSSLTSELSHSTYFISIRSKLMEKSEGVHAFPRCTCGCTSKIA